MGSGPEQKLSRAPLRGQGKNSVNVEQADHPDCCTISGRSLAWCAYRGRRWPWLLYSHQGHPDLDGPAMVVGSHHDLHTGFGVPPLVSVRLAGGYWPASWRNRTFFPLQVLQHACCKIYTCR